MSAKKHKRQRANDKTVAAVSLGCNKNLVDTEVALGALASAGYIVGAEPCDADIIIVNTCGFIESAVEESLGVIDDMIEAKKEGKCSKLVVMGCLAERFRTDLRDDVEGFDEIDLLVGTSSYPRIIELLESGATEDFAPQKFIHTHEDPRFPATLPWSMYLKIAEGCSNQCAYCRIPSLRGPYRSRTPESLEVEAAALVGIGARELILIAQDTTRYGTDLVPKTSLPELLGRLNGMDNLRRLRVMYMYPELVTDALAEAVAKLSKVCNYIDMPIQHIDDDILDSMKRRGGSSAVRRAIETLRSYVPDICIRTTVMVGYPGETKEQYEKLIEFLREARFDRLGAFTYSPEDGTPAAGMPDQVPDEVKVARYNRLMELQQEISLRKNESLIGSTLEVLVDEVDEESGNICYGRSYRDAPDIDGCVEIEGAAEPGTFVHVKITGAGEYDLFGKISSPHISPMRAKKREMI